MKYIYIISTKRGNGESEIYTIRDTYENLIIAYKELIDVKEGVEYMLNKYFMFEFPINEWFCELDSWSNIKLGKSCKYRIKFKTAKDFYDKYEYIIRTKKLERVLK